MTLVLKKLASVIPRHGKTTRKLSRDNPEQVEFIISTNPITTAAARFALRKLCTPPAAPQSQSQLEVSPNPLSRRISHKNPLHARITKMHLMYTLDASGKRVYTLKKVVGSEVTKSAHPARFSPDDKYSRHRVTLKKRYGLLLTQQSRSSL